MEGKEGGRGEGRCSVPLTRHMQVDINVLKKCKAIVSIVLFYLLLH